MQNSNRSLHYAFASIAFIVSLITFLLTVQPTVPFWDCGEFTAAAVQQQVPHPPGAPLFLMLGKLFHLLPFGDPGWRVNLLSVVASSATILLLYLITVKVIRNFFTEDLGDVKNALLVYGSAFVAAMTYTFTDTFWFNAVESEVYAASSLFVAIIVFLMMVWNEKADDEGHERYLLLIAYIIGLSIGVHLLSILTVFSLVLLIYLRKYTFSPKTLLLTLAIGLVTFFVVYTLIIMKLPALYAGNFPFKNDAGEFLISDNSLFSVIGIALLGLAGYGMYYGKKTNHGVLSLLSTSFLLIVLGYSTYGHILVRANSNPPMNENKPENFSKLVSYLGREQYGEAPTWPRRYQTEQRFVTHYVKEGPWERPPYKVVTRKDGARFQKPDFASWKTNGKSRYNAGEFKYLWNYQIDHMYLRYFLWNFMGRVSDVQDAPAYSPLTDPKVVESFNHKNGYAKNFPINYFVLPLILGLVGLFFHFQRDKKMAWVYLVLFLMTGVLAAIQQNQQNPQPRERDYFYVASFMIYSMWIGLGAFFLLEKLKNNVAALGGGLLAIVALVPINMARQNWTTHSRAGNYLAFDYAYNILQSVDKNAIVFTNGDNDTFPVWYLQDVAGVRRDVRVVNLSLGQTTWYIEQLKNRDPHGAAKLPLTFSDEQLTVSEEDPKALSYEFAPGRVVVIPVKRSILESFTKDTAIINRGTMSWTFKGGGGRQSESGQPEYFIGVQHKLVLDILQQTKFERPVYFSTSVGDPSWADEYVGLDNYLRLEGMCFRVCPTPQSSAIGEGVNQAVMERTLMQPLNGDEVFTEPHVGLKFRNLNNPNVYYDDVNRGYILNYRNIFYKYATYCLYDMKDTVRAGKVMQKMNETLSLDLFPLSVMFELQLARFYEVCGLQKEADDMALRAVASAEAIIKTPSLRAAEQNMPEDAQPELIAADAAAIAGKWDLSLRYYKALGRGSSADPLLNFKIDEIEILKRERVKDYAGALSVAEGLRSRYAVANADRRTQQAGSELEQRIGELQRRLGRVPPAAITMMP
ncbi:MAG: DUF2723 domain-containing protein [Candidatus Kapabacteria bacterium]|nr:DUF2723 domain-containing protein [Candidatus Kapabacteria bacterium]